MCREAQEAKNYGIHCHWFAYKEANEKYACQLMGSLKNILLSFVNKRTVILLIHVFQTRFLPVEPGLKAEVTYS